MGRKKEITRKNLFKAGHELYRPFSKIGQPKTEQGKWVARLTTTDFNRVARPSVCGDFYRVTDADGVYGTAKLLRPRKDDTQDLTVQYLKKENNNKLSGEMRLLHQEKHCEMWNKASVEHSAFEGHCLHPQFTIYKEIQKGLCWRQALQCTKCAYKGSLYKLYEEAPSGGRGANTATPNLGWQVGLQETTMGVTKSRVLLAATNVPPPSKSAMTRSSAKVASLTSVGAEQRLHEERLNLMRTNKGRGLPEDAPVNISIDGRYNSVVISSRNKIGQNASQAIGIAIEHQTVHKKW